MDNPDFYTAHGYDVLEMGKNPLTPSLEDYLEMVYRKYSEKETPRVHTLAEELHVKPSSVSKMLQKLAELHFIRYEKYGTIELTPQGLELGAYFLWRHEVIRQFFNFILPGRPQEAFVETERVEHLLGESTVKSLEKFLKVFKNKSPE